MLFSRFIFFPTNFFLFLLFFYYFYFFLLLFYLFYSYYFYYTKSSLACPKNILFPGLRLI
ncbi:hypothetical protein COX69_04045 [Candidatus Falkowbacteria bacterium CG_4_10_14_0_2_um_filter_48_10]|nr:MAG: hypothetical protein COX69_04045 [Candidatus Falkowbacteria bacterium CG_4_10_14_0_2_um_filter_48_10]